MKTTSEKIYRLPVDPNSADETSEVEHIELKACDAPASIEPTDQFSDFAPEGKRGDLRVIDEAIRARFLVGSRSRRFPRFARFNECLVVNISMGGICIESAKMLSPKETIVLYLSDAERRELEDFPVVAQIVHRRATTRRTYLYGARFIEKPAWSLRSVIYKKTIQQKLGSRRSYGGN